MADRHRDLRWHVYDDLPLNHPLRHFYRGLTVLIGLAMIGFGATGLGGTSAVPRLAANLAFAIVALLLGVVVVAGSLLWRHLSHLVYLAVGGVLMTLGLAMLLLLQAANFFGANMTSCLTTLTVGLVVFLAGTYTRTGTAEEARAKELRRHGNPRPNLSADRRSPTQRRPTKSTPRRPASAR
jgi:hypothetical protein